MPRGSKAPGERRRHRPCRSTARSTSRSACDRLDGALRPVGPVRHHRGKSVGRVPLVDAHGAASAHDAAATRTVRRPRVGASDRWPDRHAPIGPARARATNSPGIRPFRAGDRLRRINWPRSARTNELQVNSTWADLDTHIALRRRRDARTSVSARESTDSRRVSTARVRAAGAIAEHYAPRGERVSLRTFATDAAPARYRRRPVADNYVESSTHLLVSSSRASGQTKYRATATRQGGFIRGQLTVVLSPLIAPEALDLVVSLGRQR